MDRPPPSPSARRRIWPRSNTARRLEERQAALRALPHWDPAYDFIWPWPRPLEELAGAQEALTAHMVLPVGVVGPLPVDLGRYNVDGEDGRLVEEGREQDEVFVPLAHTEGGLSASMLRGMTAALASGGVRTDVLRDRVTRASCFAFASSEEAVVFSRWVAANAGHMRDWLRDPGNPLREARSGGPAQLSSYALLWEVDTHVVGSACHVLYCYTTGDACGMNMITRNSHALNHELVAPRFQAAAGYGPRRIYLEANMGGDKKPSALYATGGGHGKMVLAEVRVPEAILRRVLRTTSEDVIALEHVGLHGGIAAGMVGAASTPASAVAAIFAATGQDLGMVGTSSVAQTVIEPSDDGIRMSIRFPNLEVGTIGGGTGLPYARAYLTLLRCVAPGSVYRLAQVVAAAALCLELSVTAAMASGGSANFATAHLRASGRRAPPMGE